jgi:ABC-type cobalt transport system substrate-binding protein
MRIQSEAIEPKKVKKSKILKRIIIAFLIFVVLAISLLFAYHERYKPDGEPWMEIRNIFLDDYILIYEIIQRPRNIKEDILFHSIGEEFIVDWEIGKSYDWWFSSFTGNLYKIKSRNDFQYIIFEENSDIQIGKFHRLYPIAIRDMDENESKESLRGIYKTIFELIYEAKSSEDIKSIRFAKNKNIESEIKIKEKK